jgi:hypothetical protein
MSATTFLPALPDAASITDEASASDALSSALAVVATANRLGAAPREHEHGGIEKDIEAVHQRLKELFKGLHELLPKIAAFRVDITGWSVTVGMSDTLTINFVNKFAQDGQPL